MNDQRSSSFPDAGSLLFMRWWLWFSPEIHLRINSSCITVPLVISPVCLIVQRIWRTCDETRSGHQRHYSKNYNGPSHYLLNKKNHQSINLSLLKHMNITAEIMSNNNIKYPFLNRQRPIDYRQNNMSIMTIAMNSRWWWLMVEFGIFWRSPKHIREMNHQTSPPPPPKEKSLAILKTQSINVIAIQSRERKSSNRFR